MAVHYNLNCRRTCRDVGYKATKVKRHKGLTIVINIDLPKFQIVKKLSVMNWNKPSNQIGRC